MSASTRVPARLRQPDPRPVSALTSLRPEAATLGLVIALVAGAALRLATLAQQSYEEDETVTVWLLHHSLPKLLATIPKTESTPPLYYVLAWVWTRMFGTGPVGLRSLSAVLGVAAIVACYAAGRALLSVRAGVIAALLAALSPALIWYSQEARSYELLILTSAAALACFARARNELVARGGGTRDLWLWATWASLALLSHYFAYFLIAPEALWLLAASRAKRGAVLIAVGCTAVVALALVPLILREHANGGASWIASYPLGGRLADVPPQLMLGEGRPFQHFFALVAWLLAAVPAILTLVQGGRAKRIAVAIPLLVGCVGVLAPTLVDLAGMKILADRNTVGVGGVLLVGCAAGMAAVRPKWLGVCAAAGTAVMFAWALGMVMTDPMHQREDWRDAARALGPAAIARVIVYGPSTNNPAPVPPLVPFQAVYLRSLRILPERGWRVREIDVLNVRDDLSDTSPPPTPVSPGRGFRLVGRAGTRVWTLFRFRAPYAVLVTPDELIGDDLISTRDDSDSLTGLQLPTARRQPAPPAGELA